MDATDKYGDCIIMEIRGVLVDILCELDNVYYDFIVWENKQKLDQLVEISMTI